jgi:sugar diacid utilization regulator
MRRNNGHLQKTSAALGIHRNTLSKKVSLGKIPRK